MTVDIRTGRPFMRGLVKHPQWIDRLAASEPHRPLGAVPTQFAGLATQLDEWGNATYGDCVSAEEAEAKASWSQGYCKLPELFVPPDVIIAWARQHGVLNGADLVDVMDKMATDGITVNGVTYKDGPHQAVDYTNGDVLNSAIATGPVKIAIAANALPSGAGNQMGWYVTQRVNDKRTDHCVGLRGYGTAGFLYDAMKVPLPSALSPSTVGVILYTWKTYGFVTFDWIQGCTDEAHVRTPTTIGQSPAPPAPPVPPIPPTPTPPQELFSITLSQKLYKGQSLGPSYMDLDPGVLGVYRIK